IYKSGDSRKNEALFVYFLQLGVNFFWSIFFFNLQAFLLSFIWIIILWLLIIYMIILFYRIDKPAGLLQIPYLIWVTFATYLTYMIYIMN
ncbi:MAG: tryptophan-rich sensory protein, partial [Clostridia bacterium]|nr:tryptophan-rich sensory protein [Clostridia bacterium]